MMVKTRVSLRSWRLAGLCIAIVGSVLVTPGASHGQNARPATGNHLRAATQVIQAQLISLVYFEGVADGLAGPATRKSIEAFQADNGLPPTGTLTEVGRQLLAERAGDYTLPEPPQKPQSIEKRRETGIGVLLAE